MTKERQRRLLALLNARGDLTVSELATELRISEMTVRRDLRALEAQGALSRRRGGATVKELRGWEPPFTLRADQSRAGKQLIARRITEDIEEGECIFLDSGTTCVEVARLLVDRRLTVMTVSLHAADVLGDSESITTILAGGVMRPHERTMIGHEAERALSSLRFDRAVLGACGVTADSGLTAFDLADAAVKRTALASARHSVIAATGDKLQRTAMAVVARADELHHIVTNDSAPPEQVDALRSAGAEVTVVASEKGSSG